MKYGIWGVWLILCVAIAGYFSRALWFSEDKSEFLIGDATHGHYQIELACSSCHTEAFGGTEMLQGACEGCHAAELADAQDSHPKKKFNDPRNAQRLEGLDARTCVSCHTEHQAEQTHAMGVTLPKDYCWHCHKDVTEERESHKDLAFDSCASAGCHNYHDNKALYENFLVANADQPWLAAIAAAPNRNYALVHAGANIKPVATNAQFDQAQLAAVHSQPGLNDDFVHTSHGEAGLQCSNCHSGEDDAWVEKPGVTQCQSCHSKEAEGFLSSKHGMRLATGVLEAMQPGLASGDFHAEALHKPQNCSTCHVAHDFNTETAAVSACLGCHADDHSQAFLASPHGQLWQAEDLPTNQKVTCATCHLPRVASGQKDADGNPIMRVEHNQNYYLRPNEKMIRPVCMDCHSLEFSIDALADPELIKNNFNGRPGQHIPSIDWALERAKQ